MILVITHCADRTSYDEHGRVIEEAGTVTVSHGINVSTGRVVILPQERWNNFKHNCVMYEGEWYLK